MTSGGGEVASDRGEGRIASELPERGSGRTRRVVIPIVVVVVLLLAGLGVLATRGSGGHSARTDTASPTTPYAACVGQIATYTALIVVSEADGTAAVNAALNRASEALGGQSTELGDITNDVTLYNQSGGLKGGGPVVRKQIAAQCATLDPDGAPAGATSTISSTAPTTTTTTTITPSTAPAPTSPLQTPAAVVAQATGSLQYSNPQLPSNSFNVTATLDPSDPSWASFSITALSGAAAPFAGIGIAHFVNGHWAILVAATEEPCASPSEWSPVPVSVQQALNVGCPGQ